MDNIGSLNVRWIQGFTNKSIEFVDDNTVCYACGNFICFLNLETKSQSVFQCPGRGVGALTANGNSGIFAFSEQKLSPSIFVYIFPELQLKNELKGSAQLDFTSLTLSHGGPYLACCSSFPDHDITVWNWEHAEILCRQPQAGRDLISLVFDPVNWLQLCALGIESLTVWNIERSGSFHLMKPRIIDLPAADSSLVEGLAPMSRTDNKLPDYSIMSEHCSTVRLIPTAICWTATSDLVVGCVEGFLLLVDPESLNISVLINPTASDANPVLTKSSFQGLTFSKNGLIAAGKESIVHHLQIKGMETDIVQTWQLERPITTVKSSPDNETVLLSSNTGQMYMIKPAHPDEVVKVLDDCCGTLVAATFLNNERNICVSLREFGELQLWSSDGVCLGSLCLQTEVTSLACCPIAYYAAVGTASGSILFIDLNEVQQPRLVHQVHLYHTAVHNLIFDQEGHYLFSSSSDSHIYVMDARPSQMFAVIGYTVISGGILSLSTQCSVEEVKVLGLCADQMEQKQEGTMLTVLCLPARSLRGTDCVDRYGCLSAQVLKVFRYTVPHPLQSCVLGVSEVFAYCHMKKALLRFQLPEVSAGVCIQQVVELKPEQEVRAHLLGPASLTLSPHRSWLASVGQDGLLCIRETYSMEQYIELQCHSCHLSNVRSVSFTIDSHTILTAGLTEGSLVCTNLRIKDGAVHKRAIEYSRTVNSFLKNTFHTENKILIGCPAQEQWLTTKKSLENEDNSFNNLLCAPLAHLTWLESRHEKVIKEDNEQYSETKKELKETIQQLRESIQEIICENERIPEEHFNLNVEEQRRLEAEVEQEVMRVRSDIERDILEKRFLHDVLQRECWDSVKVKGKAIKAFHSELEVQNYPLKERTEKELDTLRRVENTRRIEKAALNSLKKSPSPQDKEKGEDSRAAESAAHTESLSTQLGYSNPYLYDQFTLKTTEQRINQMILLQDTIHRIKTGFNADFDVLHNQKVQEIKRIKDRNRQIRKIMQELDMNEELWEPSLTVNEQPERLLTVHDSEIKVERFLTPEQKKEEERKKLEEQSRLAAQVDKYRERGLDDMMDGMLEGKKEDFFKEIPPPEFVLSKPEDKWNEEEKRAYKEYEKKNNELLEEREKYKKSLETELRKLQDSTKEATEKFDETLMRLSEKKVKCIAACICQQELNITYLVESLFIEEDMRNRELDLNIKYEKMLASEEEIKEVVKNHEREVEMFHVAYESLVTEDKALDKDFRKEFLDVSSSMVNDLYKLFKRRPRIQMMRTQTDSHTFKEPHLCSDLAPDALSKMLQAMEELDAPEKMPKNLNPLIWERLCLIRRTKVESEHKVKAKALALAEMQTFLQRRRDEANAAHSENENLFLAFQSLHMQRSKLLMDTMVQYILKKEQVEVSITDLTANYSNIVLCHRSVVDKLRGIIRELVENKIAMMVHCKKLHKQIALLEWENKVQRKRIEDLNVKMRDIKILRPSKEQRDMIYLSKAVYNRQMSKDVATLQRSLSYMEKTHLENVKEHMKRAEQLNKQAAKMEKESTTMEPQLFDLQLTVAELRHINEGTVSDEMKEAQRVERYQEVAQMSKLKEHVRAQADQLSVLWSEAERLSRRTHPFFDQLKHN